MRDRTGGELFKRDDAMCDATKLKVRLGSWFLRPIDILDRRFTGLGRSPATHHWRCMSGFNVLIEDARNLQRIDLMSRNPHIIVQEEIRNRLD